METKDQLVKTIRDWVRLDNEIRILQKEQSKRKNAKKALSDSLIEVMKINEIDCFDINDGQILYNKKNVKKPLTKKMLLDVLQKYYHGDLLKALEVNDFILKNREETLKESITRKVDKAETTEEKEKVGKINEKFEKISEVEKLKNFFRINN
jgi:hypothetical protein